MFVCSPHHTHIRTPITLTNADSDIYKVTDLHTLACVDAAARHEAAELRLEVQIRHGPITHSAIVRTQPNTEVEASQVTTTKARKRTRVRLTRRLSLALAHQVRTVEVELDRLDTGIAPGQYAAFYLDGYCIGAGVICEPSELCTT
jgi:hypothetical protein